MIPGSTPRDRGPTFAYLVLAHDAPAQLEALIERLLGGAPADFVVLHVDRRSALWPYAARRLTARFGQRVQLITAPAAVRWGHRSQLVATRKLLDAALSRDFDMAHLLSGRDWPVAARATIAGDADAGRCCIETARGEQQERMQHWWFHARFLNPRAIGGVGYRATKKGLRIASRAATALRRRTNPYGEVWHKGSQWWSLPRDVCAIVTDELERLEHEGRLRFTACSDEHVIQTIVATRYPDRIVGSRRYTDWSTGESSPKTLTSADVPAIAASSAWFARKVDVAVDAWFLDYAPAM